MVIDTTISDQVCHTVRQLGFPKERTLRIVDGVTRDLANNGPEWVIGRLKALREHYEPDSQVPFPEWVKYRSKDGTRIPTGWMGRLVSLTNPATTVAAIMAVVNSCVLPSPTDKQLNKWHSAVADPPEPTPVKEVKTLFSSEMKERLGTRLERRVKSRDFFGPADVKASLIPTRHGYLKVRRDKGEACLEKDLILAWKESLMSAPVCCWENLQAVIPLETDTKEYRLRGKIVSDMRHLAPDSKRRRSFDPVSGKTVKKSGRPPAPGIGFIGSINFLQQPGGKLRTVANPNRFAQWMVEPLGEVLSDYVNSLPGVYVTNQEAGIAKIQRWIQQGETLTSLDLSSASDNLDYSQIVDALIDGSPRLLANSLRFFKQLSAGSWYVDDPEARRVYGPVIRWKQGQPLGLRPSFPIMTLQNVCAAHIAVVRTDGQLSKDSEGDPMWVIVGDDIVMPSRYAKAYSDVITSFGGVVNLEKSRESNRSAEFCSRLITSNDVLRLKPKYLLDNDIQNILTYQDTNLRVKVPTWLKKMSQRIGSWVIYESNTIPPFHGSQPKPIREKLLAQVVLNLEGKGVPDTFASMETFFMRASDSRTSPTPSYTFERVRRKPHSTDTRMKGWDNLTTEEKLEVVIRRTGENPYTFLADVIDGYDAAFDRYMSKYYAVSHGAFGKPMSPEQQREGAKMYGDLKRKARKLASMSKVSDLRSATVQDLRNDNPAFVHRLGQLFVKVRDRHSTYSADTWFNFDSDIPIEGWDLPDIAWFLPADEQELGVVRSFDHTTDRYIPKEDPITQVSRLDRRLQAIDSSIFEARVLPHDRPRSDAVSSGVGEASHDDAMHDRKDHIPAVISRIPGSQVDMLLEDLGTSFGVSFHSKHEDSPVVPIDKTGCVRSDKPERVSQPRMDIDSLFWNEEDVSRKKDDDFEFGF